MYKIGHHMVYGSMEEDSKEDWPHKEKQDKGQQNQVLQFKHNETPEQNPYMSQLSAAIKKEPENPVDKAMESLKAQIEKLSVENDALKVTNKMLGANNPVPQSNNIDFEAQRKAFDMSLRANEAGHQPGSSPHIDFPSMLVRPDKPGPVSQAYKSIDFVGDRTSIKTKFDFISITDAKPGEPAADNKKSPSKENKEIKSFTKNNLLASCRPMISSLLLPTTSATWYLLTQMILHLPRSLTTVNHRCRSYLHQGRG